MSGAESPAPTLLAVDQCAKRTPRRACPLDVARGNFFSSRVRASRGAALARPTLATRRCRRMRRLPNRDSQSRRASVGDAQGRSRRHYRLERELEFLANRWSGASGCSLRTAVGDASAVRDPSRRGHCPCPGSTRLPVDCLRRWIRMSDRIPYFLTSGPSDQQL